MTVYISEPFYPDASLSKTCRKQDLHKRVYYWMNDISNSKENIEYIHYIKKYKA